MVSELEGSQTVTVASQALARTAVDILTERLSVEVEKDNTAILTTPLGTRIVVTKCSALLDKDSTAAVAVRVGFGAEETPTKSKVVLTHPGIAPGSGVIEGSGAGVIGKGGSDEDLRITCEAPTGGTLEILVVYYAEPV